MKSFVCQATTLHCEVITVHSPAARCLPVRKLCNVGATSCPGIVDMRGNLQSPKILSVGLHTPQAQVPAAATAQASPPCRPPCRPCMAQHKLAQKADVNAAVSRISLFECTSAAVGTFLSCSSACMASPALMIVLNAAGQCPAAVQPSPRTP